MVFAMHISNTQIQKIFELHLHKVHASNVRPGSPARKPDQLTLSRQATEMQHIKRFVCTLPDIRQDKVRELQRTIDSGAYQTSDSDIASAILAGATQSKLDV